MRPAFYVSLNIYFVNRNVSFSRLWLGGEERRGLGRSRGAGPGVLSGGAPTWGGAGSRGRAGQGAAPRSRRGRKGPSRHRGAPPSTEAAGPGCAAVPGRGGGGGGRRARLRSAPRKAPGPPLRPAEGVRVPGWARELLRAAPLRP